MNNASEARNDGANPPPEVEFRHQLYERFPVPQVAFSADGRLVQLTGPITLGVTVGGFAAIERRNDPTGHSVVIQIRDLKIVERDGPVVQFDENTDAGLGMPGSVLTTRVRVQSGEGLVLGTLDHHGFVSTDQVDPFGEEYIRAATAAEVGTISAAADATTPTIEIGELRDAPGVAARLQSKGFSRHTFMCGQSGSGKTYTTGVLFERLLLDTTLPMMVIDPNSDHVHLGTLADPDDPSPTAERYRHVSSSVTTFRARGQASTLDLCIDFSDLDPDVRAKLLRLHPIADLDDFNTLQRITDSLTVPFSLHDVAEAAAQEQHSASIARRNSESPDRGLGSLAAGR